MTKKSTLLLACLLVLLGATSRLLPPTANVAPIGAIALFVGLYLPHRLALFAPLAAMFASDLFIGFYDWRMMTAVYGSFLLSVYIGTLAQREKKPTTIVGATLIGAIIFFLTTNAAVWAFGTMYAHTLNGLMESYWLALPFFRNSLIGDFFFVGILVGSMEMIKYILPANTQPHPALPYEGRK